ncbi:hypothetical protein Cni_G11526 [Canna indica]|uniref:Calponin-homology (CH) domain-containing protein n=1 Tax=Canna indica TaxID=4628 RepID=A0AAQ3KAF0_9LILI|nr:hypothetical protein Cni_G11526 [Canna indica]
MKRVVRAKSPDVVRVSEASPESTFRELDDVFLQTQTRIWLGEVLHIRFDEQIPIADLLADGELLFQVSKVVWKMLLKKDVELKNSNLFIYERTSFSKSDGRYMPYPKVDSFLKICQILGLTGIDLFSPSDVVEKRDIRRVCMCIRYLSKKAMSRNLSVPDFDIVTYTIAMPTDMVGGLRRSLEQSGWSSSSSGSCSMDFRRLCRQKDYNGHHDHSHDYFSESDEAESSFNELELESPPRDVSFHANIFNLDIESSSQESLNNDNVSKLHARLELEDQVHSENGHQSKQHGESISLDSIGSTCRSITATDKHDVRNYCNNCSQRCFLSHAKFPYEIEAHMGENEKQPYNGSGSENCLPQSSTTDSSMSSITSGEIIKTSAGGAAEQLNSTYDKRDNMTFDCWFQHEEHQGGSPLHTLQSNDGSSRHNNNVLDEKEENLSCDSFEGLHKNSVHVNSKTTADGSADGYALLDYSIKDEQFYSDYSCQNIDDADTVILDSESPGSLLRLPMRNSDSHERGSRCHETRSVDQAADGDEISVHNMKLFLDKTTVPSNNKLHHDKPSGEICLFPVIHTYENDAKLTLLSKVSSNEYITDEFWKDKDAVRPLRCRSYMESDYVGSASKSAEWILASPFINTSERTVSKGQDSRICDGSCQPICQHFCKSTCSGESTEQILPVEEIIIGRSHSSTIICMESHDSSYACLQNMGNNILATPCKTSQQMWSDVQGRNCIGNRDGFGRSGRCGLRNGKANMSNNSDVPFSDNSKDLDPVEYMDTYSVTEVTSERSDTSEILSTWSCSNPRIIDEINDNFSAKENSDIQYQVHLINDAGTTMNHTIPDDTEEGKKGMEECEKNAQITSGKHQERNTGKMVIKSIAGSITLFGALLVFLHLRSKKDKEKNSHAIVRLPAKETSQGVYTTKKVDTSKSTRNYPGERLRF